MQELLDPPSCSPTHMPTPNVTATPRRVIAAIVNFFFMLCCPPYIVLMFITYSALWSVVTLDSPLSARALIIPTLSGCIPDNVSFI